MLTGCSVLVGALLAVYGQVYQTGADAWQLFAGWAALIAGWAVAGRFVPLWMLVAVLTNVALMAGDFRGTSELDFAIAMGLGNAGWLRAAEAARATGAEWARGRWHRNALWAACVGCLTLPALAFFGAQRLMPSAVSWCAATRTRRSPPARCSCATACAAIA